MAVKRRQNPARSEDDVEDDLRSLDATMSEKFVDWRDIRSEVLNLAKTAEDLELEEDLRIALSRLAKPSITLARLKKKHGL
jgi:hypothetical protein